MIKGRLVYISTINLSSKKAQSVQVNRFVRFLFLTCEKEKQLFKAFSLTNPYKGNEKYFHIFNKKYSKSRLLNNLFMIFYLLKKGNLNSTDILYSRDLFVLFIFAFFG